MTRRSRWARASRTAAAAALAVTLAAGAAACAISRPQQGSAEPVLGPVTVHQATDPIRLPLDDYLLSNDASRAVARAQSELIRRCMARFGFDVPVGTTRTDRTPLPPLNDRRYGISDPAVASVLGYHPPQAPDPPPAQTSPAPGGTADSAETALLTGVGMATVNGLPVPEKGCGGEAERLLTAGTVFPADPDLAHKLGTWSYQRSREDSRVRHTLGQWSQCMAGKGFAYPDPLAAGEDPRFDTGSPTVAEIATAEADVECKSRTNLIGIWAAVETAYQRILMSDSNHRRQLDLIRAANGLRARNAAEVNRS